MMIGTRHLNAALFLHIPNYDDNAYKTWKGMERFAEKLRLLRRVHVNPRLEHVHVPKLAIYYISTKPLYVRYKCS